MSLEEARVEAPTPLLVDLNTADAEELDELPGVGPSSAEAIMEYRRINGSFDTVEELSSLHGILDGEQGGRLDRLEMPGRDGGQHHARGGLFVGGLQHDYAVVIAEAVVQ